MFHGMLNPNPRKRDAPGEDAGTNHHQFDDVENNNNDDGGIGIFQPAPAVTMQEETAAAQHHAAVAAAAAAVGAMGSNHVNQDQGVDAAMAAAVAMGHPPPAAKKSTTRMKRLTAHEVMEKFKDKGFKLAMQGEEQVVVCECNHKVQSGKQSRDIHRHIESAKHVHYLKNRHNMKPFEVRNNKMRPLPPKEVMQKFRGQPGFKIVVRNGQEMCVCLCNGKIQSNKQLSDIQRHLQTVKHQNYVRSVKPVIVDETNAAAAAAATGPPKKLSAQEVFLHSATATLDSLAKCLELNPESISMRDRDAFATALHRAQDALSKCP